MSETNDAVTQAFDTLVEAIKASVMAKGVKAADMTRNLAFMGAVGELAEYWTEGLPVNGKVPGKRGRKAKDAGEGEAAPAAANDGETAGETTTRGRGRPRSVEAAAA